MNETTASSPSQPSSPSSSPPSVTETYELRVNGRTRSVADAWLGESLLYVLRERLGMPGAKNACEQGECGSCSLYVDGVLLNSCCMLAADAVDAEIRTVEGLGDGQHLTDVQQAFLDAGAVQCGFCIPGLIVTVHDLLDRVPDPDELQVREAISGNLCRCTGYGRILQAIDDVKRQRRDQLSTGRATPRGTT